ncbi:hypothetical protein BV454_00005 [Bacillus altitudinis]|nr:hypothetical protein [Bacillus altitudinis]
MAKLLEEKEMTIKLEIKEVLMAILTLTAITDPEVDLETEAVGD